MNIDTSRIQRRNPFDIRKPETFTGQRVFDHVVRKLAEQGKRSAEVGANGAANCKYRSGGLACAVGHLIPDELYSPSMEGSSVEGSSVDGGLIGQHPQLEHLWPFRHLLGDLQAAHDSSSHLYSLRRLLRSVAHRHGLNSAMVGTITHWEA